MDILNFWKSKLLEFVNPDELDEIINKLCDTQPISEDNFFNHWKGLEDYPPESHCGKCMLTKYYNVWNLLTVTFNESIRDKDYEREYVTKTMELLLNEWFVICYG